jgi:hypothetical protein
MFAGLEVLGYKNADFDLMIADFLVACAVDVEALEPRDGCCVV